MKRTALPNRRSAGFTLVEIMMVTVGVAVVMYVAIEGLTAQAGMLQQSTETANVKRRSQELVEQIERDLVFARGARPLAFTTVAAASDAGDFDLDNVIGFPPFGALLVGRGTPSAEYARHTGKFVTGLSGLARGENQTSGQSHAATTLVMWAGLAEPIDDQVAPAAQLFDGQAAEFAGPVFFRGAGHGFAYQLPIDPAGGNDYLVGGAIRWGAEVNGARIVDGWHAFQFDPRGVVNEATEMADLNRDGDRTDQFDLGQIQRVTWDAGAPGNAPQVLSFGPSTILQEQGNWGGDLDGDGFSDPLFLWDADSRRLSVRLNCLVRSEGAVSQVHQAGTVLFLRNDPTP